MVGYYLFANNATSRLRVMTPAASGTITVESGHGERFPNPSGEDFFMVTLDDRRSGQIEIMKCTARSGDVLTVLRAQEGTTAQDFNVGTLLSNRPTAGTFTHFMETATGLAGYDKVEADERFVNVAGDIMQGPLELILADPVLQTDAAHKKYVDAQMNTRAPLSHTHSIAQVTGLQNALDIRPTDAPNDGKTYARMNLGWVDISNLASPSWGSITGKPSTYPPSAHTHPISEVTNLQAELNKRPIDAPLDGVTYGRKNGAWEAAAGAASIGDNPPSGADDATFWWSTATGGLYILYDDGNTTQWVQVGGTSTVNTVEEAPLDDKLYGRKSAAWTEIVAEVEEAPIDGQQYVRQDGAWAPVEVPPGTIPSDTPPAGAPPNTLWWEPDTGNLYILYDDGDSEQWVQVAPGEGGGGGGAAFNGGTITADLTITKVDPILVLDKHPSSQSGAGVQYQRGGVNRWWAGVNGNPEANDNSGSDYAIYRCLDDGTWHTGGAVLNIDRYSGWATFSNNLSTGGSITAGTSVNAFDVVSVRGSTTAAPSHVYFHNPSGVERALIYAVEDGALTFRYAKNARFMTLNANGVVSFTAGTAMQLDMYNPTGADGGFRCKYGPNNSIGANWFNMWWDNALYACVDKLNLGQIAYVSDYRVKKDVAPLGSTWDIVKALNPIAYTQAEYSPQSHLERMQEAVAKDEPALEPFFVADDKERWGFIAHELQETIIPTAASAYKDAPDAIQSPDPWPVIATLTRTIQEMQERIEALEAGS